MRKEQPRPAGTGLGTAAAIGSALGLAAVLYVVLLIGGRLDSGEWTSTHPVTLMASLFRGTRPWTGSDTLVAVAAGVLIFGGIVAWVVIRARGPVRHAVDRKARHMGNPASLSRAAAERKAAAGRLGGGDQPGLMFGRSVSTGADLWAGWREGMLVEMGPGSGKTTGIAVPLILDAPGVVVATSNKRDLADAIRGPREDVGTVWVFDPQRIADYHRGGSPSWWWNPLRQVTGPVQAAQLATIFADANSAADAKKDAYFDTAGRTLLANLLLAAAAHHRPLTDVYRWVSNPKNQEPVDLLKDAGHELPAASLAGSYAAAPDERSGLFGTAAQAVSFLTSPDVVDWVTDPGRRRLEFMPEDFIRSGHDTLLSLSREGAGTAGPLTTALTVAVTQAAERVANEHPHGRLPVPLVALLDEVANVCRWRELPSQFSFYGSTGIFLVAILQNHAQGVRAWGKDGMQQMWDAATVRVLGAGLADRAHLADVAQLIGERHVARRSVGRGSDRRMSTNTSWERELILSVDELAGLPAGRIVVVPAGEYPILGRTVPWFEREAMRGPVAASVAEFEPHGQVQVQAVTA